MQQIGERLAPPGLSCCIAATILLSKDPATAQGLRTGGVRVVLNNLSGQIRECLQHAEECAREAAELPNSSPFRQDFLQLEKRWLELARSIEFGEQLDSFTKNSAKSKPPRSATMR